MGIGEWRREEEEEKEKEGRRREGSHLIWVWVRCDSVFLLRGEFGFGNASTTTNTARALFTPC